MCSRNYKACRHMLTWDRFAYESGHDHRQFRDDDWNSVTILFNADATFPYCLYGVCYFADTWQWQRFINISYKGYQDTRPGRTALPSCNNKNPWRQLGLTRVKQPRVMIAGGMARLQPSRRRYIGQNGVCGHNNLHYLHKKNRCIY